MARLEELLAQFNRGEASVDELETQLRSMAAADPRAVDEMASMLRQAAQSGALNTAICTRLISVVEAQRFAVGDVTQSRTQVSPRAVPLPPSGGGHRVAPDATLHRTPDAPLPVEKTAVIEERRAAAPEKTEVIADRRPPAADKTALIADRHPSAVDKTAVIADRRPLGAEKTLAIAARHASNGEAEIDAGLAANLATSLPADAAPPPSIPSFLEPGSVVKERFLLKESIGRGGMGIVFSAVDRRKVEARDPNPMVAIKILNTDFARHPKALMALQREARKAQTLAHPNVATVFDFDREGDAVFMTMELLRGRCLDQITREVRGRGMESKQAWPIICGIAEGLAYAHRKGIVHSDLKPGNIFIQEDGHPKILDFGIARAVPTATASNEPKDIFDAGSLGAYTETYATAEMVEGVDPHPADDVYALGLISYELLTGAHPYQRYGALQARAMGLKPAALKGLTRRQCRTLERSVSLDRQDRPRDAAEFLKQLSGITKLQKNLIAASLALALTAGYFGYRSYQEAGPAIPFERLSTEAQEQFKAHMSLGGESWTFYEREKNSVALLDAVDEFEAAYRLHPRNREASAALRKAADAVLAATEDDAERQRAFARNLAERSDYLSKYAPVREAER